MIDSHTRVLTTAQTASVLGVAALAVAWVVAAVGGKSGGGSWASWRSSWAKSNSAAVAASRAEDEAAARSAARGAKTGMPAIDRSGRERIGVASFYAQRFGGRKMADGQIMDLQADNAASRTLPLGTTAVVTNLETGQRSVVTIQDRGPYARGRIVDLSPSTAQKIGLTRKEGITRVAVAPIAVPLPDGRIKLGAGAHDHL